MWETRQTSPQTDAAGGQLFPWGSLTSMICRLFSSAGIFQEEIFEFPARRSWVGNEYKPEWDRFGRPARKQMRVRTALFRAPTRGRSPAFLGPPASTGPWVPRAESLGFNLRALTPRHVQEWPGDIPKMTYYGFLLLITLQRV